MHYPNSGMTLAQEQELHKCLECLADCRENMAKAYTNYLALREYNQLLAEGRITHADAKKKRFAREALTFAFSQYVSWASGMVDEQERLSKADPFYQSDLKEYRGYGKPRK